MYYSSWNYKSKFNIKINVNDVNDSINDAKLYVPVVTLSTQENIKLFKQLESGFKSTINWNKYLAKTTNQAWNRYLDYLIDSSFQGGNRLFVLSLNDDDGQKSHKQYYLPTVEIKDYVMIDGRNFFDQSIKKIKNIYSKNFNRSRRWLYNWLFARLSLFQKILQVNCKRLKQTTKTRSWSKRNTTN